MTPAGNLFRSLLLGGLEISDLAECYLWAMQWQSVGVAVLSFGFSSAFPSVVHPRMLEGTALLPSEERDGSFTAFPCEAG